MTSPLVTLDPWSVERVAQRVNELVLANLIEMGLDRSGERSAKSTTDPPTQRLVDAQTVARALGVSRDCVYAHAAELGGQRIGDGPRGRLRFDLDRALEAWTSRPHSEESQEPETPAVPRRSAQRSRKRMGSGPALLPVKGPPVPLDAGTESS
jgi:hypothetical protein